MTRIVDLSPRTGRYEGDLKFGRKNGTTAERNGDYSGTSNEPICPLVLIGSRDSQVWTKDPYVKEAKKNTGNSQHLTNGVINTYLESLPYMRSNIHLTVGKQRF